jgi:hypothetical protein
MALDFLRQGDCSFYGPALPGPYVQFELEKALTKHKLLPDADGLAGEALRENWEIFRRKLRDVSPNSGPIAITNRILEPLVSRLGYSKLTPAANVLTREGDESGGAIMTTDAGATLRCWAVDFDADLEAPTQRGYAYRFSPVRIAQRVLLTAGERVGLITNGTELRLLMSDPARPESHIEIDLNVWRLSRSLPDGYQLLLALASPAGVAALPEIIEDARLKQNKVTKTLREQAKLAIREFTQAVLDQPENADALAAHADKTLLAKTLWHEGLVVVYRLLFILKCESTSDPSRVFRFSSTPLWRNTYSPSTALAKLVRRVLDEGVPSGRYLEDGLRVLFKLFAEGMENPGLTVRPLGGALFGAQSTPLLSSLRWGELAVAHLLDRLLWSDTRRGRERVHYGPLDVEDLGRVYEALLELEPGIATERMCRLRRQKLEVVVPAAQGEKYREESEASQRDEDDDDNDDDDEAEEDDDKPARGKKTKVEWIEAIPKGRFFLRVGLGRKSSGSYYTPHSFVRFLVQETLGPQCDQRSPRDNPDPGAILKLKVLDPACGSGHFLVEACRFLASRVYEAARLCDELATKAEHDAEAEKNAARKKALLDRAAELRQRLKDLPDQEDELLSYLPSRSAGAEKAVLSAHDIARAEAICRRLVAVHCLYGVDLNPLAVELAKLSLWIESHAEGFPLTFLDHRIVLGNSLTGPFWERLVTYPCRRGENDQPLRIEGLFAQNLDMQVTRKLGEALALVRELEASVGADVGDIARKAEIKRDLDDRLLPFRVLAAAWSGGVMLGSIKRDATAQCDDEAYAGLLKHIAKNGQLPDRIESPDLARMIARGLGVPEDSAIPSTVEEIRASANLPSNAPALPYDLVFPEVFHPTGQPHGRHGFDGVLGNPPWDAVRRTDDQFFGTRDFRALVGATKREKKLVQDELLQNPTVSAAYDAYVESFESFDRAADALFEVHQARINGQLAGRGSYDLYMLFAEQAHLLLRSEGRVGWVLPSSFHATEGATGVRRLYLRQMSTLCCFSFENKNKLFKIHSSFKFATVVAANSGATSKFACAFYLHDDEWLFTRPADNPPLSYTLEFVERTGGEYLAFLELRSEPDVDAANQCFALSDSFERACSDAGIVLSQELNMTYDAERFEATSNVVRRDRDPRDSDVANELLGKDYLILHEGKTFWHFDDHWGDRPRYVVPTVKLADKAWRLRNARYFRLAFRDIAAGTNERTVIFCFAPPALFGNTAPVEQSPAKRPNSRALVVMGAVNAFVPDWTIRVRAASHVNLFIMNAARIAPLEGLNTFLAHSSLRLTCSHAGYEKLWREQLGDNWKESGKGVLTWPVLTGDDKRWEVRAAIDAAVAAAYGLSRKQYKHVLSTFNHSSYPKAPQLCLTAFDELKKIGLEKFCKKHDPYWDIPLNEDLPKPVIDLPIPDGADDDGDGHGPLFNQPGAEAKPKRAAKKMSSDNGAPDPGKLAAARTFLELKKVVTAKDVESHLGLDAAGTRAILKHLIESGIAVAEGKSRSMRYSLKRGK